MESIIGFIVIFIVVAIIVRVLRARYEWIDGLFYGVLILGTIVAWIAVSFWMALAVFFVGALIVSLLLGNSHEEKIKTGDGRSYTFECDKCGYNHVEVRNIDDQAAIVKCPRCGHVQNYILK